MATPSITRATAAERESAIGVLMLAFATDPVARWSWPDAQVYVANFPSFVDAFAGQAFASGGAYCADGSAGAALWLPPGREPNEDALGAVIEQTVAASMRNDIYSLLDQMGRYHPSEPHWYLPLIGVDPMRQGQGYGSALMRHALAACDRDGMPAYLESTNPRNVPLYERHGFALLGTIQAGSSPPMYPMLRASR